MSPRRRKEINRSLPPGGRVRAGYYSWTNPETGEETGIGRNRQRAIAEMIEANAFLASKRLSLVERLTGAAKSMKDAIDDFEKILEARKSKPNTVRTRKSQMVRLRRSFDADAAVGRITTLDCSKVVDAIVAEGKARSAQAFRSFLIDFFDRMIAKGHRKDNPARVLDPVRVKVKRARLTLEAFQSVYRRTSKLWLRNAMALAIVSAQPRECVAAAQFSDFRDGYWWNGRGKTEARAMIPTELRLNVVGLSIDEIVSQCRKTGIVSKYLVHQTERAKGARLGSHMHIDQITRAFTAEVEALGLDWGGKEPPTFHEIRSLAERLHSEQGSVDTQHLLMHKDRRTTATYHDGRGEWVKVTLK